MRKARFQNLREDSEAVQKGLHQLSGLLHGIKVAALDARQRTDPTEALEHVVSLAGLGSEHAEAHAERASELHDLIDDLDQPVVDMTHSAMQAGSIRDALAALLQVIPEDQTDTIGTLKTVLKLSFELSNHLITGGHYKYVLKEALEEQE